MMQKRLGHLLGMPSHPFAISKKISGIKFSTTQSSAQSLLDQLVATSRTTFYNIQRQLDSFFSITEVRDAQMIVTNVEKEFLEARRVASKMKQELADVRVSLEEARKTLDRCPRDSENFLRHVAEEHAIINKERKVRSEYETKEQKERELFTEYSNAVRVSHEKERERAQKTKYLSIVASVGGAVVGFLGSSLITYYRLKQIREITSPDVIVDKISHEIKENNITKDELDRLFESNNVKFMKDLDEKFKTLRDEKLHFTDINDITVKYASILEETGKSIKKSEDEMKTLLDSYILKVSDVSQTFILDLQNSTKQVTSRITEHTLNSSIARQLQNMEEKIVDNITGASGNFLNETKVLKNELANLEKTQRQLQKYVANESTQYADVEMYSERTWYPEANLILSFFSFGLLVYLAMNRS